MSIIKEKFIYGFRKNHVDKKELVKTNVIDNDKFRYYEPQIPAEELRVDSQ